MAQKEILNIPEHELEDSKPSAAFEKVMREKPRFASDRAALEGYTQELEALAARFKMSVEELLNEAESSGKHHEDYIEALMLARRVAYFRKKIGG